MTEKSPALAPCTAKVCTINAPGPALLKVKVSLLTLPTVTVLAKFTLVALQDACGRGTAVPTPVSATDWGDPAALLVMVNVPLALPTVVGAKITLI